MKFKYVVVLVAILPLITFAVVNAQPRPPAASQDGVCYENAQWHVSLVVPTGWHATAFDSTGNETIQFVDIAGKEQFQVGVWGPYQDLDVALGEEGAAARAPIKETRSASSTSFTMTYSRSPS